MRFFSIFTLSLLLLSCDHGRKPDFTVDYNSYDKNQDNYFQADWLVEEKDFLNDMNNSVQPYLDQKMSEGQMECSDGNIIHYESFKKDYSKGVIVIFHGFSGFTHKYNEQAYYFLKAGFQVVIFDHMGHGKSSRKIDNLHKVHTENFEEYIDDADEVINKVAKPMADGKPLYLYAHSMGGGIGCFYIEKYPETFSKVILNCPMIEINTGILGESPALILSKLMCSVGNGKGYVPGNRDFDYEKDAIKDESKIGPSVSFSRKHYHSTFRFNDKKYTTSGATYSWTKEAITATKKIRSKNEASKIKVPVLLFQAENDSWVKPKGQYILRDNAKTVKIIRFPETEHEIFASHDKYLYAYYNMILEFFTEE